MERVLIKMGISLIMNRYDILKKLLMTSHTQDQLQSNRMGLITGNCLEVAKRALAEGKNPCEAIFNTTIDSLNRRYSTMEKWESI